MDKIVLGKLVQSLAVKGECRGTAMDKIVFGKLVQSLRKEHRDEYGTLWTQEMLAHKSGLEKRAIERIEQGVVRRIDPEIVLSLADALELTTLERKEFFFAAMGLESRNLASARTDPGETLNSLLGIVESVSLPAAITDVFGDVVAINTVMMRLFELYDDAPISAPNDPVAYNMMRVVFAPDSKHRQILSKEWSHSARQNMQLFRGTTLRYRSHPYFKQTLAALWRYKGFRRYWEQAHHEDADSSSDSLIYKYTHPTLGPLRYVVNTSSTETSWGELYSTMYISLDQRTSTVFEDLVQRYGHGVVRLATWPKP